MENNYKELTWDDIRALNAETARTLDRISKMFEKEKQQREEERQQREEERQQREEERQKREVEEEKKRKKREVEEEKERKKREVEEEKERKKREEEHRAFKERMDYLNKLAAQNMEQIGGISKSNGEFCEEYFINSFKEKPTLFGEKFDRVLPNHVPDTAVINDEYDLVLRNGTTVALIEMKYKAKTADVGKMFLKLRSYRANYPNYKDYKTYLCLASFSFTKFVKLKAEKEGIVLIRQRGEKIEVLSENIRTW